MTRILISGPPASGKSTLAADLAARIGGAVIDYDVIAREFGSTGHDHPKEISLRAHAEVDRRIREMTGPAVLIKSAPVAADREAFAKAFGADATYVLTLPADTAKGRAEKDDRPTWTASAIDRWWAAFEPSDIDTSRSAMLTGDQIGLAAMADATPETPAEAPQVEAPAPVVEPEAKPLGENGEKALRAERDARKAAEKTNAEILARLKEFEDRDKSEAERQTDRLANLEKTNRELALEKARYEAAFAHGLSKDDLALLGPGDDIAERAALLAQRLGAIKPEPKRLPESPGAGREPGLSDEDAEYSAFMANAFPNHR